jgi:hypothetical protein
MKNIFYKISVAVLVILNGVLLVRTQHIKSEAVDDSPNIAEYINKTKLPNISILDRNGRLVKIYDLIKGKPQTMFIFFNPSDCPSCLEEKFLWGQIAERGLVRAIGLASNASSQEFWSWAEQERFPIEIYLDTSFALADSLQFRATPLKLLVDENGKIYWVDPLRIGPRAQKIFWKELSSALEKNN